MDGVEAYQNLTKNKFGFWNYGPSSVKARLDSTDIVIPYVQPKPIIGKDSKLFVIGSCFTRELDFALAKRGRLCLHTLEYKHQAETTLRNRGCSIEEYGISKYNCFSVLNELRWALDKKFRFPEEAIVQDPRNGLFVDLHGGGGTRIFNGVPDKLDALQYRQALMTNVFKKITECDVILITLGVAEVWFDNKTKLYINISPTSSISENYPNRFSFEVSTFNQNMAALEEIYTLLKQHCRPGFRIIVMMGPSPLYATFTNRDILTANTYSKAMLRTAADCWAQAHEEIEYFPSFEMAMNSRRETVWRDDAIHLQPSFTLAIIDHLLSVYDA